MVSKIEWTQETWNPVSGCTPCSPGCLNCYARALVERFPKIHAGWIPCGICGGTGRQPGERFFERLPCPACNGISGRRPPFSEVICHPDRLSIPLHWRKPRVVFFSSMGDAFHPEVPDDFLDGVFSVIAKTPRHTYFVLTKRIVRAQTYFEGCERGAMEMNAEFPWSNVHLGVTVCTQAEADEKIPILLDTPAAHRFVSVEPCLEAVKLPLMPDAVIVGCESGPRRRPMPHKWVADLVQQCDDYGTPIPCMVKQIGTNEDGTGKLLKGCPVLPWLGERRNVLPWLEAKSE